MALNIPPLKFDIDLAQGDFSFGPDRDLAIVAGGAMIGQRVALRLKAARGTHLGLPDYGAGLTSLLGTPLTAAQQESVQAEVTIQALQEPLVTGAANVATTVSADGLSLIITGDLSVANTTATTPLVAVIT